MPDLLLAIDSGTTSTRALVFAADGSIVATAQYPITQHFPEPGRVEHDIEQIWDLTCQALCEVIAQTGIDRIAGIGITNQRETIAFWSRASGKALAPAIVWQDRRTADMVEELEKAGLDAEIRSLTGLVLDPYFSATKIGWAMRNWPRVGEAARAGDLMVGTIDSWLVWCLTKGAHHLTDASNASRTQLMELATARWSPRLADLFGVPMDALPRIVPMCGRLAQTGLFGRPLPITGMAGDQQAATIGQACLSPGMAKCTYGTGIFMLANAGSVAPVSHNGLLSTYLLGEPLSYAQEGSVFVGGTALKWLRDELRILDDVAESACLAASVPDNGGVVFVPAFVGLGAPRWEPRARGLLTGLTAGTTRAHIVRAALEAMGQQTADLIEAFTADGVTPTVLRVDGGMVANDWLCQDLADSTGLVVERPRTIETTALGAAMLAGVGVGMFPDMHSAARAMVHAERGFHPRQSVAERARRRHKWQRAIAQTITGIAP